MANDFYKYTGFWWQSVGYSDSHNFENINGPYCIDCYADLDFPSEAYYEVDEYENVDIKPDWKGDLICSVCRKKHSLTITYYEIRNNIAKVLNSAFRARLNKIALDEPIAQVKVRDEDDKYFLAAKIGQKDGKKVGVVYFGEKNKDQNKKDYSQIFIDLEDEQVRFDKANKHPKDIVAIFSVEFPETKVEIKKKK